MVVPHISHCLWSVSHYSQVYDIIPKPWFLSPCFSLFNPDIVYSTILGTLIGSKRYRAAGIESTGVARNLLFVHDTLVFRTSETSQSICPENFESGLQRNIARVARHFLSATGFLSLLRTTPSQLDRYSLFSNSSGHLSRVHSRRLRNI